MARQAPSYVVNVVNTVAKTLFYGQGSTNRGSRSRFDVARTCDIIIWWHLALNIVAIGVRLGHGDVDL